MSDGRRQRRIGLASLTFIAACGGGAGAGPGDADSGLPDANAPDVETPDAEAPDAEVPDADAPDADGGAIASLDLSPLALTPSFSPAIHDYDVRCAAGDNPVTLTVTDEAGTHTSVVHLVEDEELEVGDYWIRCVPHDFPHIVFTPFGAGPTPGYYLANSVTFAIVLDTNGVPVWYARGTNVLDVDAPAYDTIAFVPNGTVPFGWSSASTLDIHALDTSTTTKLATVGSPTDVHEHQLLANGHYLLFTYPIENHVDLSGLGSYGSNQYMADCEVQEIDAQGNLVASWLATDHIDPVKESLEPMLETVNGHGVVDVFHCNSIDVDSSGNWLISARQANALYYVDHVTGTIQWKLGGTPYNRDGATHIQIASDPETAFNLQHDARFLPNGDVTVFDDHGADNGTSSDVARGVEYAIDHVANTASVVFQYLGLGESLSTGSFRRFADGHSLIGWGVISTDPRTATEIDATGNDVLDITSDGGDSYRVVKAPLSQLDIEVLRATAAK